MLPAAARRSSIPDRAPAIARAARRSPEKGMADWVQQVRDILASWQVCPNFLHLHFATGKRALKSVLRTVSIESAGVTLVTEARFAAPQPPSARKVEAIKQARARPTRSRPSNLSKTFSPAVAPHCHIYGDRPSPQGTRQEMPLGERANSDFIYNCGHSANIVRPTQ